MKKFEFISYSNILIKILFSNFRFLNEFSGVFQHYLTIVSMWSLVTMCGALLMIQIQFVSVAVREIRSFQTEINFEAFNFVQFRYIMTII